MSSTDPSNGDRLEKALEVFVYAPLGVGLWLRDLAPSVINMVVARGRAEVDRRQEQAQQRITTARSMGQVALAFGVPELKRRAEKHIDDVRTQADRLIETVAPRPNNGSTPTSAPAGTEERDATPAPSTATRPPTAAPAVEPTRAAEEPPPRHAPTSDAPRATPAPATARSASSAHLPIPGYDALSASQVVERLVGLGGDELAAVREYETAHRNRRTILGKIDQLGS